MTTNTDDRVEIGRLSIARPLAAFVADEATVGLGLDAADFWGGFESIVSDLTPRHDELLSHRDLLQRQIDDWHRHRRDHDPIEYEAFLHEIGYLRPTPETVAVQLTAVDTPLAVSAPQLVVPADNARYALNAANARWGSLYDALYGTDVIPEDNGAERTAHYNQVRGRRVIATGRDLLDEVFPLERGSHAQALRYRVEGSHLRVELLSGDAVGLADPSRFTGSMGRADAPTTIVLTANGLNVRIVFDAGHPVGADDLASIADILVEAAVTTIIDLEDSVSTVDVEDKLVGYRNWLGLMRGDLAATFEKDGTIVDRRLKEDLEYIGANGRPRRLSRCSLLFVRNTGMHLETDMVLLDGRPIPETMLDAAITVLCAKHDLLGIGIRRRRNSKRGSVYVVKPKMHGPDEVALACELFGRVEDLLDLHRNTIKMGIMDEERRTSLNLLACIDVARERVVFINTGFLDRTGDEIHTSMEAGPMIPKGEMKTAPWLLAYEDANVDAGLATGLNERGQIGKGMWAMPDEMAAMLEAKSAHPRAGASCAWVPSPTAATLHALHYLRIDVRSRQGELSSRRTDLREMLHIPTLKDGRELSADEIQYELDNNAQGILGYVARWVGQGVGCSTVPDLADVGLMEDRATLRISSQHMANWLHHGIVTEAQVRETMTRMAAVVDEQNAGDPAYQPMTADLDSSIPFNAALDLVLHGRSQPNGYTEFILTSRRQAMKTAVSPASA